MIINDILFCEVVLSERDDLNLPNHEPIEIHAEGRFLASQIEGYYEAYNAEGEPDGTTWVYFKSGKRLCMNETFLEFDAMFTDYILGEEKAQQLRESKGKK